MTAHYRELMFTSDVRAQQSEMGTRHAYSRGEAEYDGLSDALGENEAAFISTRDSFYMASIGSGGWPYIQHRGGAAGFVKVLNERQIGFADFRGNGQYISLGNVAADNRVSLFFMDYPRRARLKLLGRMHAVNLGEHADLASRLIDQGYNARIERGLVIDVEAFDWNCPQHITPRFTAQDVEGAMTRLQARIAELEIENAKLKQGA